MEYERTDDGFQHSHAAGRRIPTLKWQDIRPVTFPATGSTISVHETHDIQMDCTGLNAGRQRAGRRPVLKVSTGSKRGQRIESAWRRFGL